jgi:hypothetical protein
MRSCCSLVIQSFTSSTNAQVLGATMEFKTTLKGGGAGALHLKSFLPALVVLAINAVTFIVGAVTLDATINAAKVRRGRARLACDADADDSVICRSIVFAMCGPMARELQAPRSVIWWRGARLLHGVAGTLGSAVTLAGPLLRACVPDAQHSSVSNAVTQQPAAV